MTGQAMVQLAAFGAFSLITLAGALGMATTMSMFRSGLFLMASLMGVAGLFLLLSADLLGLLQVMMYLGGMLVMILFMALFSADPGGAMMAGMAMAPIERLFTLGVPAEKMDQTGEMAGSMGPDAQDESENPENPEETENPEKSEEGSGGGMEAMSMVTPIRPLAAGVALAVGAVLSGLLLWRRPWVMAGALPDAHSARAVGSLLMDKYMIAFEGAGMLILLGIFGAVYIQRPAPHPVRHGLEAPSASDEAPPGVTPDTPPRVGEGRA